LDDLSGRVVAAEERKQRAYDLSRRFQVALAKATSFDYGCKSSTTAAAAAAAATGVDNGGVEEELRKFVDEASKLGGGDGADPRTPRPGNLSHRMEDYVRYLSFRYFLDTGRLLPPPSSEERGGATTACTDEEVLGAYMGLCQDLQRYGLGRATVRDRESVVMAADLVSDVHQYLLGLDFRNGPLRRKFDGTKYALKGLETVLYELAVTSSSGSSCPDDNDDGSSGRGGPKRQKRGSSLLPEDDLKALRDRMVHRDELRETLIKQCRDGQKGAKQSIFALHRGDLDRARQLLAQCKSCIVDKLSPIAKEEPPLRTSGSFSGVMEEYVEAVLFAAWLHGRDWNDTMSTNGGGDKQLTQRPSGVLLKPDDFDVPLELDEYFGGLCDLTGEIGRYAVQRGTARDEDGVKLCLGTCGMIWRALQTMERLPGGIGKKMEPLQRCVEKLERMLYEMSLSQAAGGRNVHTEVNSSDIAMDEKE